MGERSGPAAPAGGVAAGARGLDVEVAGEGVVEVTVEVVVDVMVNEGMRP